MGFVGVLALLLMVNLLAYGLMHQAEDRRSLRPVDGRR